MSLNLSRDRRKSWQASGPAKSEWIEAFKKQYGSQNTKLMEKYRNTIYQTNTISEIIPKDNQPQPKQNWKTV